MFIPYFIDRFYELSCRMYEKEMIPKDFQKNMIVTISEKVGVETCEDYRTINLFISRI